MSFWIVTAVSLLLLDIRFEYCDAMKNDMDLGREFGTLKCDGVAKMSETA